MAEAKWSGVLSTTEPRNDVGIIKVRQGNINSEIAEFQIVQNNKPYDLTGLTVYFCASFGLNLVEKPAVVINTTGGRIQYTFDDDSMQSVGRNKGYFSIKKAESKIDSTQDFEFHVDSSLMTRSIDGKSYIYKLSTLIKVLDDFIKNGQNNFNTWFDSVKEILYGVDPGGNVLRELIEARRNSSGNIFASLKARLDKNEDDTAEQFAHIAKKTYVTYSDFGAVLDGVHNDFTEIKAAHDYANAQNRPIKQTAGKIFFDGTIEAFTSTDLSGCELIMNDLNKGKTLYRFPPTVPFTDFFNYNQSELKKNTTQIRSFSQKTNSLFHITSSELIGYRGGNSSLPYVKQEMFTHVRDGIITSGKALNDFTKGTLIIKTRPIDSTPIVFVAPKIIYQITDVSYSCKLVKVERDNFTLDSLEIVISNETLVAGNTAYKGELVEFFKCYNSKVINVFGPNITGLKGFDSGYILTATFVNKLKIDRCTMESTGWGIMGTHFIKGLKVVDSDINRIDCHYGLYDMTVDNCTLHHTGLIIGDGDGTVNFLNSRIILDEYYNYQGFVVLRTDLGRIFRGRVNVDNVELVNKTLESPPIINVWFPSKATQNEELVHIPDIRLKDIQIESELPVYLMNLQNIPETSKDIYLPYLFEADNVYNKNEDDVKSIYGINIIDQFNKIKTIGKSFIRLNRINRVPFTKIKDGYAASEIINGAYYSSSARRKTLFLLDNDNNVNDLAVEVSVNESFGSIYNKNDKSSIKVLNSTIHCYMPGYNLNNLAMEQVLLDSKISFYPDNTGDFTTVQTKNLTVKHCEVHPYIVGGAESIVALTSDSAKLLLQNVIVGTIKQTQNAAVRLWESVGAIYRSRS